MSKLNCMTTRRAFLAGAAAATGAFGNAKHFPYAEFEQRIAKKDFREMTKDVLPTPCMVVDIDLFEKNLKTMADYGKAAGIQLRPHVKVHKSVDIAKRQMALGAIGVTAATIAESELMSRGGIRGVLWTKQPASDNNVMRAVQLSKADPTFLFVVDDAAVIAKVEEAAAAAKVKCKVVISVFAGLTRQGIANGQPAVELAKRVMASKQMSFEGWMAYSGGRVAYEGMGGAAEEVRRGLGRGERDDRAGEEGRVAGGDCERWIDGDLQHG